MKLHQPITPMILTVFETLNLIINHQQHQGVPRARIPLIFSHRPSLSDIILGQPVYVL